MLGTWRCFTSFRYDPIALRPVAAAVPAASVVDCQHFHKNSSKIILGFGSTKKYPRFRMFLQRVRVTKYRSIRDSGWFDVEKGKTILIGPNEAGKTALLEAIQRINPPLGTRGFDSLRDYPRSEYDDINRGKVQ